MINKKKRLKKKNQETWNNNYFDMFNKVKF